MPGSQPTDFTDYELGEIHGRIAMWEEVKRLNAAPVQQVSVPGGWRVERGYSPSGYVLHSPSGSMVRVCDSGGGGIETAFALFLKAMLAAAPAAPKTDDPVKVQLLEALKRIVATPFSCREKSAIIMCDIASAAIAAARKGEGE